MCNTCSYMYACVCVYVYLKDLTCSLCSLLSTFFNTNVLVNSLCGSQSSHTSSSSFLLGRSSPSDLPSLSLFLSPFSLSAPKILLSLCLSLRLKTFQFSCHKLCSPAQLSKQGGVPFIPPHILRKEMGGRRALTLVFGHKQLSLIIVFLFSFPVPMEV